MADEFRDREFFDEEDTPTETDTSDFYSDAVLHSSDWTVETIVAQLRQGNIDINPKFQRRDAWDRGKKSRFIESAILGLPIPQLVLAERKGERGRYIVLDGKQRLLTLLQYTGNSEGLNNGFGLSGLDVRTDLLRKRYHHLKTDLSLVNDLNAFHNSTIRTVVIRNWPNTGFLHLVFVRLNTGSVSLSPQELRQALFPGGFADAVDDSAAASVELQTLLGRNSPDPRMRDVELLVRFLGFHYYLSDYQGRLKDFLDMTSERLGQKWELEQDCIRESISLFMEASRAIIEVFGAGNVAKKVGSTSFNRAIYDVLVFYAVDKQIRDAMVANADLVQTEYNRTLGIPEFSQAVDSDTAGIPNTLARLSIWGDSLRSALCMDFHTPTSNGSSIVFDGFWD